jgi:hypothetical protein
VAKCRIMLLHLDLRRSPMGNPRRLNDCEQTLNALERHASAEPIEAASAQGYSSPVLSFYP